MSIATAAGLAVLIVALFAWLLADMGRMETRLNARIDGVETGVNARVDGAKTELSARIERVEQGNMDLRERMARIEGMLDGLRDSIAGRDRRDAA